MFPIPYPISSDRKYQAFCLYFPALIKGISFQIMVGR